MSYLQVVLPVALLLLVFLLKLVVDRRVDRHALVETLYHLPVDVSVLATSFVIAFTISSPTHASAGLLCFVAYMACTVLVVLGWRRSLSLFFEDERLVFSAGIVLMNLTGSVVFLLLSINLLLGFLS